LLILLLFYDSIILIIILDFIFMFIF